MLTSRCMLCLGGSPVSVGDVDSTSGYILKVKMTTQQHQIESKLFASEARES